MGGSCSIDLYVSTERITGQPRALTLLALGPPQLLYRVLLVNWCANPTPRAKPWVQFAYYLCPAVWQFSNHGLEAVSDIRHYDRRLAAARSILDTDRQVLKTNRNRIREFLKYIQAEGHGYVKTAISFERQKSLPFFGRRQDDSFLTK